MKIKILTVLSLSAFLLMVGCKGGANTNTTNTATTMNSNSMVNSMANTSTPAPAMDSVAATTVKDALDKAGLKDVTVTATTTEVTLRGTVPKGKLGEAVRIANETGKRKVTNSLSEK